MQAWLPTYLSLATLLWMSAAVRLLLVCWGELQDRLMQVKYTDIDYVVFTDAARFVASGGSPFERSTYRYSPLLAYLLLPNIWLHGAWGKLLFCAGDILAASLISRLLRRMRAPPSLATLAAAAWLCNPFTLAVSTRGSCDVLAVLLLLALLQLLLDGRTLWAAAAYGLVVHLRIYPIVFAPSLVLFLAKRSLVKLQARQATASGRATKATASGRATKATATAQTSTPQLQQQRKEDMRPSLLPSLWSHPPSAWLRQVVVHGTSFGLASGIVFLLLGAAFYVLYGQRFLDEAFLHHLTRKDPRHNFSPHFYPTYLSAYGPGAATGGGEPQRPLPPRRDSLLEAFAASTGGVLGQVTRADLATGWGGAGSQATAGLGEGPDTGSATTDVAANADRPWVPPVGALGSALQLGLQLVLAAALHGDLPTCLLLQTMAFVALNKVCTAQYFVWYFSLVPLVLPRLPWPPPRGLMLALVAWAVTQLHWLLWGYLLEFQGLPVHLPLWGASIVFQGANAFLMVQLLRALYLKAPGMGHASTDERRERARPCMVGYLESCGDKIE